MHLFCKNSISGGFTLASTDYGQWSLLQEISFIKFLLASFFYIMQRLSDSQSSVTLRCSSLLRSTQVPEEFLVKWQSLILVWEWSTMYRVRYNQMLWFLQNVSQWKDKAYRKHNRWHPRLLFFLNSCFCKNISLLIILLREQLGQPGAIAESGEGPWPMWYTNRTSVCYSHYLDCIPVSTGHSAMLAQAMEKNVMHFDTLASHSPVNSKKMCSCAFYCDKGILKQVSRLQ